MSSQKKAEVGKSIPHWHNSDENTLTIVEGEGATVYDQNEKEYLDFISQLYCSNAGHSNEIITDAMVEQAKRIPYVSSAKHNDLRTNLANSLAEIAPGSLSDVIFSVSGSEANEIAIQAAREVQDAPKVLTRWQSYHGATYAAGALSGDPSTRTTIEKHAAITGVGKFLPPHPRAFDADSPEELAEKAANHVEYVIRNEGVDSVAAILMEPVAGTSGAYPAPPGYFERLRDICDEYDVLLISDEVITGFGRCGEWFGIQTENICPDMITFAKGVTSAYAPLAGVIVSEFISEHIFEEGFEIGQTFAGHPVSCAAGLAAMEEYRTGLIDNVNGLESYLESHLRSIADDYDAVEKARGRGFLWSVVFSDPETGEPFVDPWGGSTDENPVKNVREIAKKNGVLFGGGRPDVQVLIAPPFCTSRDQIDDAMNALRTGVEEVLQ